MQTARGIPACGIWVAVLSRPMQGPISNPFGPAHDAPAMSRIGTAAVLLALTAALGTPATGQRPGGLQHVLSPLGAPRLAFDRPSTPSALPTRTLLDERRHFGWSEGAWRLAGTTLFTYEDGDRLEQVTYDWGGLAYEPAARVGYFRNDQTRVVVLERWDVDAQMFIPEELTEYLLVSEPSSGAEVVSEETRRVWQNQVWTNLERTRYTLDETMNVTGSQTEIWGEIVWVPYQREAARVEGASVVVLVEGWDGASWINVERYVFPFATIAALNGALRAYETETADLEAFLYALHLLPVSQWQTWEGFYWLNANRQVVHLEPGTDRRSYVAFETWSGTAWVEESRLNYEYEGATRLVGLRLDVAAGPGVRAAFMHEGYEHDGAGRLTGITHRIDLGAGLTPSARDEFYWSETSTAEEAEPIVPGFLLASPYPNPFTSTARIAYQLEEPALVVLRVYDAVGRQTAVLFEGERAPGSYEAALEAAELPNGLYLVRLETPKGSAVRPVILLR